MDDSKINYSVARVVTHTRDNISKFERHNERKNQVYSNMNIELERTDYNVYYKKCETTLNEKLKEMVDNGEISLRGLKSNAKVFDELVFDINSDYFEKNGGYTFAKFFYEEAFHFAEREMGTENILSAVMHADELNVALTEEYGKPIYHYHLHVIAIPVVRKEIKWSKRCKDKSLVGKTKEVVMQVSHSKKWKSEQATDLQGNLLYDENGKAILIKSYSVLQDKFYKYMVDAGYDGFIRGVKGSSKEHLENLDFKIKKETEQLEKITKEVNTKEFKIDRYLEYDKQIEDVSNLGKQKKFSKKVELEQDDYENLVGYAKKGIVADKVINSLKDRIEEIKHTLTKVLEKYDNLVEKTKDYIKAISLAPQRVANFFKSIFDKEKQDELERQRKEQERLEEERKARELAKEKARLQKQMQNSINSLKSRKRRAGRDAR